MFNNFKKAIAVIVITTQFFSCSKVEKSSDIEKNNNEGKVVIYQVFTRLFGNLNTNNKPWGTIEENGVGKFNDFTDLALAEIKNLGVTHIWYTGVPHHALISDYTSFGISNDDADVVKGRAGSPYAVKDYYNVNPDLAVDPTKRLEEFESLIKRTHNNGMKVIIDIVPNHVARKYEGKNNPKGVKDFGANDDTSVEYNRSNNFYYIPGEKFKVPVDENYKVLGGNSHESSDGIFDENPAKWTGNGSRMSQPHINDWYETVKVNYGVRPDGTKDFPELPLDYASKSIEEHFNFWKNKDVPDSWIKFKDIALFWIEKGVDGFRYDMAEMVPYEFWSYMNSAIKMKNPDAFLLAEVYNPKEYRNYIHLGKMDYLYDKVELYDKLKDIIRKDADVNDITKIQNGLQDIEHHMLHFLDNHDEQRLANEAFAGSGEKGRPLMVLSTLISSSPTMIYFGQEVGEKGSENAGFGQSTRTSIFDYIGVPEHQKWMNNGKFDGGKLSSSQKELRNFYSILLNYSLTNKVLKGAFTDLQVENKNSYPNDKIYSFARFDQNEQLLVINNFSEKNSFFDLLISKDNISKMKLKDGNYRLKNIFDDKMFTLIVKNGEGKMNVSVPGSHSLVLPIQ